MDRTKITTFILILLIGVSSIILGIMFANIKHYFTGDNVSTMEMDREDDPVSEENVVVIPDIPELFETCILISIDKNSILNNKDALENNGYSVRIKESKRANKLIYSLIIDKQSSKEDAILIGEEIKEKFPSISTYWVEKISETEEYIDDLITEVSTGIEPEEEIVELSGSDREEIPEEIREIPVERSSGTKYEVQILANTDIDKVEAVKMLLETEGYKLKIIEYPSKGEIYYRLRLAEAFTLDEGKRVGEELKRNFKFISNYWLDKKINL